jgi:hypothetical protein
MKKHFQSKHFRNRKSRMIATFLCGAIMLSAIWYWREQYLQAQEFVPFQMKTYNPKAGEMRSSNYQLQTQEISPSVK